MEEPVNPWTVETLTVYLFYCCPECDIKCSNEDSFVEHALTSHTQAREAFDVPKSLLNPIITIEKNCENNSDVPARYHHHSDDVSSDSDMKPVNVSEFWDNSETGLVQSEKSVKTEQHSGKTI